MNNLLKQISQLALEIREEEINYSFEQITKEWIGLIQQPKSILTKLKNN